MPSTSPPELDEQILTTGVSHDVAFARELGERNWIAPEWPREGFEPMSAAGWHVVEDELTRVDSPVYAVSTSKMAGQVISNVGPEWMRNEILPKVQRGEVDDRSRHERTGSRFRCRRGQHPRPSGRRWLDHRRPEDVHDQRPRHRLRLPPRPHRPRQRTPQRPHHVPGPDGSRGIRGAGRVHAFRRAHQHHLLQRAVHRGSMADLRGRRRLAHAHARAAGRALGSVQRPPRPRPRRDGGVGQ